MFPDPSKATQVGKFRVAINDGKPSPLEVPPPATVLTKLQQAGGVVRTPLMVLLQGATLNFRMRLFPLSAIYKKEPVESIASPRGALSCAEAASVLSITPDVPKPTTVVMIPVARLTARIRLKLVSAI